MRVMSQLKKTSFWIERSESGDFLVALGPWRGMTLSPGRIPMYALGTGGMFVLLLTGISFGFTLAHWAGLGLTGVSFIAGRIQDLLTYGRWHGAEEALAIIANGGLFYLIAANLIWYFGGPLGW